MDAFAEGEHRSLAEQLPRSACFYDTIPKTSMIDPAEGGGRLFRFVVDGPQTRRILTSTSSRRFCWVLRTHDFPLAITRSLRRSGHRKGVAWPVFRKHKPAKEEGLGQGLGETEDRIGALNYYRQRFGTYLKGMPDGRSAGFRRAIK